MFSVENFRMLFKFRPYLAWFTSVCIVMTGCSVVPTSSADVKKTTPNGKFDFKSREAGNGQRIADEIKKMIIPGMAVQEAIDLLVKNGFTGRRLSDQETKAHLQSWTQREKQFSQFALGNASYEIFSYGHSEAVSLLFADIWQVRFDAIEGRVFEVTTHYFYR